MAVSRAASPRRAFWAGRRVFVTGHTGFKGGWLATWLVGLGAVVTGYALKPESEPSYFALCRLGDHLASVIDDVRDDIALRAALADSRAEIVFHLAAQPLVRRSFALPVETFATNAMGTVHLLEAVRQIPTVRAVVLVTSDKVYAPGPGAHREDDRVGGPDPYSASKGCAELVAEAYRRSFFTGAARPVGVATARAGNVVGGGDWAEDRLVPDAVRAVTRGEPLLVRHPDATRPWQHVLDPLCGYLRLAEHLHADPARWSGAWNFGPDATPTVAAVADAFFRRWGRGGWRPAPPTAAVPEAPTLALDAAKARELLGWRPVVDPAQMIELTVAWYQAALGAAALMYDVSRAQIHTYESGAETA